MHALPLLAFNTIFPGLLKKKVQKLKITEFNKISYLLTSKTYHHKFHWWKNQLGWIPSQNLQILNTAIPGRVHILQTLWRLWGTKTFSPWHNTLPQNNYQHMYSRNCLAWQEIVVDILEKNSGKNMDVYVGDYPILYLWHKIK